MARAITDEFGSGSGDTPRGRDSSVQEPGTIMPYAGSGSGEQDGAQRLSTERRPMPADNLSPFAAGADGPNEDHHLTARSCEGNTLGDRTRGLAGDAARTRQAPSRPTRGRGTDAPAPDAANLTPGMAGARPGYDTPDPVWRDGERTTTQRP